MSWSEHNPRNDRTWAPQQERQRHMLRDGRTTTKSRGRTWSRKDASSQGLARNWGRHLPHVGLGRCQERIGTSSGWPILEGCGCQPCLRIEAPNRPNIPIRSSPKPEPVLAESIGQYLYESLGGRSLTRPSVILCFSTFATRRAIYVGRILVEVLSASHCFWGLCSFRDAASQVQTWAAPPTGHK